MFYSVFYCSGLCFGLLFMSFSLCYLLCLSLLLFPPSRLCRFRFYFLLHVIACFPISFSCYLFGVSSCVCLCLMFCFLYPVLYFCWIAFGCVCLLDLIWPFFISIESMLLLLFVVVYLCVRCWFRFVVHVRLFCVYLWVCLVWFCVFSVCFRFPSFPVVLLCCAVVLYLVVVSFLIACLTVPLCRVCCCCVFALFKLFSVCF